MCGCWMREAGNPASSRASAQRWAVAARSPGAWVLAPQAGPQGQDLKVDRLGKEQSLLSQVARQRPAVTSLELEPRAHRRELCQPAGHCPAGRKRLSHQHRVCSPRRWGGVACRRPGAPGRSCSFSAQTGLEDSCGLVGPPLWGSGALPEEASGPLGGTDHQMDTGCLQTPSLLLKRSCSCVYKKFCYCCYLVALSCQTLCDPMDCSRPGSSIHGILQASVLEWVATPFSRGSSQPRDRTPIFSISFTGTFPLHFTLPLRHLGQHRRF